MRHRKKKKILDREKSARKQLLRNLADSLFRYGKIKTTLAKAKTLRSFVEPLITRAKNNDLATRRYLLKFLSKKTANKLLNEIGPKYQERAGGYTRIIKLQRRKGDNAPIAIIELI